MSTLLFTKSIDKYNCYFQINAGAGGTDSCDWSFMLAEMYSKWLRRQGMTISTIDIHRGDYSHEKYHSVTFHILGEYAFGHMQAEAGVHRLVRISPYDSQNKRHTSFAQVLVYPDYTQEAHRKTR